MSSSVSRSTFPSRRMVCNTRASTSDKGVVGVSVVVVVVVAAAEVVRSCSGCSRTRVAEAAMVRVRWTGGDRPTQAGGGGAVNGFGTEFLPVRPNDNDDAEEDCCGCCGKDHPDAVRGANKNTHRTRILVQRPLILRGCPSSSSRPSRLL